MIEIEPSQGMMEVSYQVKAMMTMMLMINWQT